LIQSTTITSEVSEISFWSEIDAVLVINLDHRIERWESLCAEAEGIIPAGKLHRISAVLGTEIAGVGEAPWFRGGKRAATWAGRGGCVLAHRRALETARAAGWGRVLILEDDATFDADFIASLRGLETALFHSETQWDICFLGFTHPQGPFRTVAQLTGGRHLAQIYGCKCTHAYLLNAELRDWVLEQLPDESTIWPWLAVNRAIDRWYQSQLGKTFLVLAVSPQLILQRDDFSDIVRRVTSHFSEGSNHLSIPLTPPSGTYVVRYFIQTQMAKIGRAYNHLSAWKKRFSGF
jgi:GR25 family glycosyltransferase involved in LPS biosynthesis